MINIISSIRYLQHKLLRFDKDGRNQIRAKMIEDGDALEKLSKVLPRVSLEPTNACNARCGFCAYRLMERKKGVMDLDTYQGLVNDLIGMNVRELKFTPIVGDPLVDHNIVKKIEYAVSKDHFSRIYMYTNLINLHLFDAERFVNSGITDMTVSACIADSEMYRRVFGVDAYDKVIRNIKDLILANNKFGDPVDVLISLRNEKPKEKALNSPDYKELIAMGAKFEFLWDGYDNWSGLIEVGDLPEGNSFRIIESKQAPCAQLYNGFIVGYDGTINICWCRDLNLSKELTIGKYPEDSLEEAWQGPELRQLRENWEKGDLTEICQRCLQYTSVYDHKLTQDTYERLTRAEERGVEQTDH